MSEFRIDETSFLPLEHYPEETTEMVRQDLSFQIKRAVLSNPFAILSIIILAVILVASVLAPLSPYDPDEMNLVSKYQGISLEHWLGTDNYGRDYFTRILYGGRVSLVVGFFSMLISTGIGTIYGTISGFFGGTIDAIMMRIVDILLSIPSFLVIVMLNSIMKTDVVTLY